MTSCPVCRTTLSPVDYEGFRILQCDRCKGHLVPLLRLESIKRIDRKSPDELRAEAAADFKGSAEGRLTCPRCRSLMHKQAIDIPVLDLLADFCDSCSVMWFDGGELALFQLGYEASHKFINARQIRRRMQELNASPGRKAAFEEALARLPDHVGPVEAALDEAAETALDGLLRGLLRGRLWPIPVSLPAREHEEDVS